MAPAIWQYLGDVDHYVEPFMGKITSLGITRAASYWYPTMLAEAAGEINENKAAELLGMGINDYRMRRYEAIKAVMTLIEQLPSPFVSIMEIIKNQPEFFNS